MVPLLGGAFSACVYHFFYNSPQLDALVALQVTSLPALCLKCIPLCQPHKPLFAANLRPC